MARRRRDRSRGSRSMQRSITTSSPAARRLRGGAPRSPRRPASIPPWRRSRSRRRRRARRARSGGTRRPPRSVPARPRATASSESPSTCGHVRIHRDDRVAGALEIRGDAVRVALGTIRDPDHGDAPEVPGGCAPPRPACATVPCAVEGETSRGSAGPPPPRPLERASRSCPPSSCGGSTPSASPDGGATRRSPIAAHGAPMSIRRLPVETAALDVRRLGGEHRRRSPPTRRRRRRRAHASDCSSSRVASAVSTNDGARRSKRPRTRELVGHEAVRDDLRRPERAMVRRVRLLAPSDHRAPDAGARRGARHAARAARRAASGARDRSRGSAPPAAFLERPAQCEPIERPARVRGRGAGVQRLPHAGRRPCAATSAGSSSPRRRRRARARRGSAHATSRRSAPVESWSVAASATGSGFTRE